jgi:glucose repression regulatory protein TUP1
MATQQNTAAPHPGSPYVPRPTPPPSLSQNQMYLSTMRNVGSLADLDMEQLPPQLKREGADWYAVFNPNLRRTLDVELCHTLVHSSVVSCLRFSLDGRYVATGCNRVANIYDVETGQLAVSLQDMQHSDDGDDGDLYIRSVCFSPDGKCLATGAEDNIIRVWEIVTAKVIHQFTGHDQDIYSIDYARNGKFIASGSGDRTVRLWDVESGQQFLRLPIDDGVTTVRIAPNSQYIAAGSLDKSVHLWDTAGNTLERLEGDIGHSDSVYSVAFSPDNTSLVSGSLDKTVKLWDLSVTPLRGTHRQQGRCIRTFEGHKVRISSR